MIRRLILYLVVGASGVVVNMVVLTAARWLLPHLPTLTYLFAVEASIISNYLLNARFTFRDRRSWRGLGQYNLVSAAGAILQTGLYRYLMTLAWFKPSWHYLAADLIAIPVSTVFGFIFSSIWVFKKREERHEADGNRGPEPRPQGTEGHS